MHFFNSFPLETDFFFCNFRIEFKVSNRKQSDEAKQYSFNLNFKAKVDFQVFRLPEGIVSENLR
tara:strand:- start:132 stop:323 length:192 start_codon:yes stop_codon:yes gene_type:complete